MPLCSHDGCIQEAVIAIYDGRDGWQAWPLGEGRHVPVQALGMGRTPSSHSRTGFYCREHGREVMWELMLKTLGND